MSSEILVVDDDEAIRQLLRHRLENAGYAVQFCADGRAAADTFESGGADPDLCIFDVMMPRLNGTRLLKMVRNGELDVRSEVPVILLTSRGREEHVTEGFSYGADDYVTKPFRAAELVARVERHVDA